MPENNNLPLIWDKSYLGENSKITFEQIVKAFVDGVPGMAAVDIGNCLIYLMKFCRVPNPSDLQRAAEFLNHASQFYYGIDPNWNAPKRQIFAENIEVYHNEGESNNEV